MEMAKGLVFSLASFFAGSMAPAVFPAILATCETGCLLEQSSSGLGCQGAIQVIWSVAPGGSTGQCDCRDKVCEEIRKCDLTITVTFAVNIPFAGCVFDRAAGGQWGQTGYTTTIKGCNARGVARQLGWSTTCDPTAMTCTTTFVPFCSSCVGRECL
jgi:hypothetical protein